MITGKFNGMAVPLCRCRGFTLTELAVVLVIVALLLGGLLVPISSQYDIANAAKTQATLNDTRDALLGFAVANGRLPCPAAPNATGVESPAGGNCTNAFNGFVPAASLGIGPTDSQGYLLDGWGNRIHYVVTVVASNAFTNNPQPNGIAGYWETNSTPPSADLHVCMNAASITSIGTASADCPSPRYLTNNAVAVIFSVGKNPVATGAGPDEQANLDGDRVFVSHDPTPAGTAGGSFSHLVTWLSPNILFNRMVAAGKLP